MKNDSCFSSEKLVIVDTTNRYTQSPPEILSPRKKEMKTLQKFCCCLSLTKGGILIGCFKIIATIVTSIQIVYNILKENEEKEEPDRGWGM